LLDETIGVGSTQAKVVFALYHEWVKATAHGSHNDSTGSAILLNFVKNAFEVQERPFYPSFDAT
jgi:hypothetical protein